MLKTKDTEQELGMLQTTSRAQVILKHIWKSSFKIRIVKDILKLLSNYASKKDQQVASLWLSLKNLPTVWEMWVESLIGKIPQEKEMETHSSILAWRIL